MDTWVAYIALQSGDGALISSDVGWSAFWHVDGVACPLGDALDLWG